MIMMIMVMIRVLGLLQNGIREMFKDSSWIICVHDVSSGESLIVNSTCVGILESWMSSDVGYAIDILGGLSRMA